MSPRDPRPRTAPAVLLLFALLVVAGCTSGTPPAPGPTTPSTAISASAAPAAPTIDSFDLSAYPTERPVEPVPDVRPDGIVPAPNGKGMKRYTEQTVTWRPCEKVAECATVLAPLDYDDPDGLAVTLALLRVRGTESPSLGSLFVNPGGPGIPGTAMALQLAKDRFAQYDVVGWDPRGTGGSTPVQCDPKALTAAVESDTYFLDQATLDAYVESVAAFDASCLARSGVLLQHVSTSDSVEDLELLRVLLDESDVNLLGVSYGSALGALYATTYPDRSGRMVLNAAFDPGVSPQWPAGFEQQLAAFADFCVEQKSSLGADRSAVIATIHTLIASTGTTPLGGADRPVTYERVNRAMVAGLGFGGTGWVTLMLGLQAAVEQGDGSTLLEMADNDTGRDSDGVYSQGWMANAAIFCADRPERGAVAGLEAAAEAARQFPVLGAWTGLDLTCDLWPVEATPLRTIATTRTEALVISATGDPIASYSSAESLHRKLQGSTLLSLDGDGHEATRESGCVFEHIVTYLVEGTLPPPGTRCP